MFEKKILTTAFTNLYKKWQGEYQTFSILLFKTAIKFHTWRLNFPICFQPERFFLAFDEFSVKCVIRDSLDMKKIY